jgi:hypothetical protein
MLQTKTRILQANYDYNQTTTTKLQPSSNQIVTTKLQTATKLWLSTKLQFVTKSLNPDQCKLQPKYKMQPNYCKIFKPQLMQATTKIQDATKLLQNL